MKDVIIAVDQGTSSTRALLISMTGKIVYQSQQTITQYYPKPGWVEQSPAELLTKTQVVIHEALEQVKQRSLNVISMGITNQRETTVVWDKTTGEAIYNAIVWQDRRTQAMCTELQTHAAFIKQATGLLVDPYFSATKIKWILDNVEGAKQKANEGKLAFGTIDTFLIWHLTGGKSYFTEPTNASRTMLYNIHDLAWDEQLLTLFDIPKAMLPDVVPCHANFGTLADKPSLKITGVMGDQQAALVGQQCFQQGQAKVTLGTGAFLMINSGQTCLTTEHLLSTIAYQFDGAAHYAIEGSIFNAGTTIKWLRDELKLFDELEQLQTIAAELETSNGVYLVPAFTGLGAPQWRSDAKAIITGLGLESNWRHIIRAGLEAVAYQVKNLLSAAHTINPTQLYVDGGMSVNNWLMQYMADVLQLNIIKQKNTELTAQGAAMVAAIGAGMVNTLDEFKSWQQFDWTKSPLVTRDKEYQGWLNALHQCVSSKSAR